MAFAAIEDERLTSVSRVPLASLRASSWNDVTGGDQGLPEIPYPNLDWGRRRSNRGHRHSQARDVGGMTAFLAASQPQRQFAGAGHVDDALGANVGMSRHRHPGLEFGRAPRGQGCVSRSCLPS
jgi:hypothetical protein